MCRPPARRALRPKVTDHSHHDTPVYGYGPLLLPFLHYSSRAVFVGISGQGFVILETGGSQVLLSIADGDKVSKLA